MNSSKKTQNNLHAAGYLLLLLYYDIHLNSFKYDGIWLCEKESIKQTNKQNNNNNKTMKSFFYSLLWKSKKKKNIFPQHNTTTTREKQERRKQKQTEKLSNLKKMLSFIFKESQILVHSMYLFMPIYETA